MVRPSAAVSFLCKLVFTPVYYFTTETRAEGDCVSSLLMRYGWY